MNTRTKPDPIEEIVLEELETMFEQTRSSALPEEKSGRRKLKTTEHSATHRT